MSREKHTFTSAELPHIWAHQSATWGKCPGNGSFDGDRFYSYSTVIAQLIKGKHQDGVVLNATSYSVTTSATFGPVRNAVRHLPSFTVQGVPRGTRSLITTGPELRDYYLAKFEQKEEPHRMAHINAQRITTRGYYLDEAIRVCEFFGISARALHTKHDKFQPQRIEASRVLAAHEDAKKERAAKAYATRTANEIKKTEKWLADDSDVRPLWLVTGGGDLIPDELKVRVDEKNRLIHARYIDDWRNGGTLNYQVRLQHAILRVVGDEVETSMGARFPEAHAIRAWRILKRWISREITFGQVPPGIKVGHYTVTGFDGKIIEAGCHRIEWPEVEALAERRGWANQRDPVPAQDLEQPLSTA